MLINHVTINLYLDKDMPGATIGNFKIGKVATRTYG